MKRVFYCMLLSFLIYGFGNGAISGGRDATADENVQQAISELIKPLYVCCGDSCFEQSAERYRPGLTEYKGTNLTIQIRPKPLSEADKLNGIAWAGGFSIFGGKAMRVYNNNAWSPWEGGTNKDGLEMFTGWAIKKNGQWIYGFDWTYQNGQVVALYDREYQKGITCADIPGGNASRTDK